MTPHGGPLSEKDKVYAMCILFPILWPFIPVLLICDLCEWIRDAYWRWRHRHDESYEWRDGEWHHPNEDAHNE